jgi:biopolymer transport protein ExbB
MKKITCLLLAVLLLAPAFLVSEAGAQDLREAFQKAETAREKAAREAAEAEARILNDRELLAAEVERLEALQADLETRLAAAQKHVVDQEALRTRLEDEWAKSELDFKEISGNVRLAAKDLESLLHQSPFTAFDPERLDRVTPLISQGYFPDIDDISGMAEVIFEEIILSGQVAMREAEYVARDGSTASAPVLTIGKFNAAYQAPDETGFLSYSPEGHRFYALSRLPGGGIGKDLEGYLAGKVDKVPVDLSRGAALRQVVHAADLKEQIMAGGPIVYPLAGIALLALLIILYKTFDLNRISLSTATTMKKVLNFTAKGDYDAVEKLVKNSSGRSPILGVIEAGLEVRDEDRETQESVLQESILRQLPRIERGLAVLAVLGAIAPLLGLLGTVTGMIETFRVITLFGTGDPKLMSGGISEALVTTMVGLAVSIPIMLLHTFLNRRADGIVGQMEEKAVQMTNLIQMNRKRGIKAKAAEA